MNRKVFKGALAALFSVLVLVLVSVVGYIGVSHAAEKIDLNDSIVLDNRDSEVYYDTGIVKPGDTNLLGRISDPTDTFPPFIFISTLVGIRGDHYN